MLEKVKNDIVQSGRRLGVAELSAIKETVELFPSLSRSELAETICEHLGWYTVSGSSKWDACMKLLKKMELVGEIKLPVKQKPGGGRERRIVLSSKTSYGSEIVCGLKELHPIRLEAIRRKESESLCNEYFFRYHYLGYKKPIGFYQRYFIRSGEHLLGCLLFSGAAQQTSVRDKWIGWDRGQRLKNLCYVINNTRFLIFPWVRVRYLGSQVLGKVIRRIGNDWEERWGYRPVLVETFVDPRHYEGICYRAAGWEDLGMSSGGGFIRKGKFYKSGCCKKVFVKSLVGNFRSFLCERRAEL